MLEKSYGQLLSLCALKGWLGHADAPAAMVRSEIIEAFVQDHVARGISAMTTHMRVERILRMARILDPAYDLEWLREIALDLEDRAHPRSKVHKIVDSARLRTAGLDLMRRAERSTGQTNLQRARLYRDGLMIALLTVCPIRLGNFARLQIGQQVRRERDAWWIVLEASETKGRRPDERPIPDELTSFMDRWVDHWRGFFRAPAGAFWASTKGGNLAYTYVGTTVADITRRELGVAINPHAFRDCLVFSIAIRTGEMGIASAALQHTRPKTTERHYNKGRMIEAARALREVMRSLE